MLAFFQSCPTWLTEILLARPVPACPASRELFLCWARMPNLERLILAYQTDGAGLESAARLNGQHAVATASTSATYVDAAGATTAAAANFPSLKSLHIHLSSRYAEHLARAALSLTDLDLSIRDSECSVLASLATLTELRKLVVRYSATVALNPLTPRDAAALRHLCKLRVLCVFAHSGHQETVAAADALTDADFSGLVVALPHLVELMITAGTSVLGRLTGASLRSVGENCRQLEMLYLSGEWDVTSWRQSVLVPLFPQLKTLQLGQVSVRPDSATEPR
jgi:hypothetical protein